MKKIYFVHGWGESDSSEAWLGWIKEELKKINIDFISFNMPNTDEPVIEEWVGFLKENIKEIDSQTYFLGHSIGCQAILRFLETFDENKKIAGCIFVAPWMKLNRKMIEEEGQEAVDIIIPWEETQINFEKVKKHTQNFLAIFSDDDPYVPLKEVERFKKELNAKTIIKHNEEHFIETKEIPEILDFVK